MVGDKAIIEARCRPYGAAPMSWLVSRLDRHFFAPLALKDLAMVRILLSAILWIQLVFPGFAHRIGLGGSYGLDGQLRYVAAADELFAPIPSLKILMLPFGDWGVRPEAMFIELVWWVAVTAASAALVGLVARFSMFVLAWSTTLLIAHAYSFGEFHHPETIPTLATWVLAMAPIGGALSLDALRKRSLTSVASMQFQPSSKIAAHSSLARWPLRVVQWVFVLAYLSAGISKLQYGGLDWLNGLAISSPLVRDWLWAAEPTLGSYLVRVPYVMSVLALFTLLLENFFILAIFVPRLTPWFVLSGAMLHGGIFVLQGADFIQWPLLYIVFIDELRKGWPGWLRWRPKSAPKYTVIYDGLCPLCIGTMVKLDAFDSHGRLQYLDLEKEPTALQKLAPSISAEEARHAMHLVDSRGGTHRGFFAFRELARQLPALWILLPLFYAPLASSLGPRIYEYFASRRERKPCRADTCEID